MPPMLPTVASLGMGEPPKGAAAAGGELADPKMRKNFAATRHVVSTIGATVTGAVIGTAAGPIGILVGGAAGAAVGGTTTILVDHTPILDSLADQVDTVHAARATSAAVLEDARCMLVTVTVPQNCSPGDHLRVDTGGQSHVACRVPPGCHAGSVLRLHFGLSARPAFTAR